MVSGINDTQKQGIGIGIAHHGIVPSLLHIFCNCCKPAENSEMIHMSSAYNM